MTGLTIRAHGRFVALGGSMLLAVMTAACGGGTTSQPAAGPNPTLTSAAVAKASPSPAGGVPGIVASPGPVPSPVASPSPAPSPAAASSPSPAAATASPAAAAPAPAGGTRLELVAGATEARFRAREQFANRNVPNDAVGTTREVSGSIVLGPNGAIVRDQSRIVVDLRSLRSDSDRRDSFIKQNTLQTDRFPNAEFVATEARGLPAPLPRSGQAAFQLVGDLTVHGVTRQATWDVSAELGDQQVSGTARTPLSLGDHGMETPRVAAILRIDDPLTLELEFRAARTG